MARADYIQRERRLINDYLTALGSAKRILYNARLGPIPFIGQGTVRPDIEQALISNKQMFVDAVRVTDAEIQYWEAKIILTGTAIGQLLEYQAAGRPAELYSLPTNLPITLHIVAAFARPTAVALAGRHAISVNIYTPSWLTDDAESWDGSRSRPIDAASATVTSRESPASASR